MALVLIVSASADRPTWGAVQTQLEEAAVDVVVFESDRVALGEQRFTVTTRPPDFHVTVGARTFSSRDVHAAWWRKPHWLWLSHEDRLTLQSVEHEINRLQQSIWGVLASDIWLNDPAMMRNASSVHRQLMVAAEAGFEVPVTVVSNEWASIEELASSGPVALKALNGHIENETDRAKTVFTSRLEAEQLSDVASRSAPYPAVIQNFVDKAREWRVTVVGDEVFAASIYARDEARSDWRRFQLTEDVKFDLDELPESVAARCRDVTTRLGLRYAAIDLVERVDGEFVFLEANSNGQYAWLEQELGLPISVAITRQLRALCDRNAS